MKTFTRNTLAVAVISAVSGTAMGAGFSVHEQSTSAVGSAYAGSATLSENASNQWFNPATLSRLDGTQMSVAANQVMVSTDFKDENPNNGSTPGNMKDINATVPAFYLSSVIKPGVTFGLGINSPFGTTLEYQNNWGGDYYSRKSTIQTVNINPQMSFDVTSTLSFGLGFDVQNIKGDLYNAGTRLKGNDIGYGWNAGLLFEPIHGQKFGLAYRSSIDYRLNGTLTYYPPAPMAGTYPAYANLTLPDKATVSWTGDITDRTQLMADISRTSWSMLDTLAVRQPTGNIYFQGTPAEAVLKIGWVDSNMYSLGIRHELPGGTVLRAGWAFEQSSQDSPKTRSALAPDANRNYAAIGATFKPATNMSVDVSYAHVFVNSAKINRSDQSPGGNPAYDVIGTYDLSANIIGAQLNYKF